MIISEPQGALPQILPFPRAPHMGEFNGHISPPELIEFVASAASLRQEVFQAKQLKKSAFSTIVTTVDFPRFRSVP